MVAATVLVQARDPITRAGLVGFLRARREVEAHGDPYDRYDVAVVGARRFSAEVAAEVYGVTAGTVPAVLVVDEIGTADLRSVGTNVVTVLSRRRMTGAELVRAVLAAVVSGDETLGERRRRLAEQVEAITRAPAGAAEAEFTQREVEVLRLTAEGCSTAEISARLHLSERSIKQTVFGITTRLNFRNRSHAVAYALRTGVI
ncbi:LuxR C-terminal-related transcriptional regulator [Lentzea sp. NPDC042327]|uniref:helix-turn-helix transcriptional regulator n=1 Tax=Lentzea sp. NPDC042327 TaxID=3154801 RepID=UPI0033EC3164